MEIVQNDKDESLGRFGGFQTGLRMRKWKANFHLAIGLKNLQYQDLIPNITSKILFDLVNNNEAFCKQQVVVI